MKIRSTPISNSLHHIAHSQGLYWAAAVVNTLRDKNSIKGFRYALAVRPNGDVCGARDSYQMNIGEVPSIVFGANLPVCIDNSRGVR